MLGAERLFADRQRALVKRPRPGKVALVAEQIGEIVEARRRIGMLGAERLFADRQGIAEKLRSLGVSRAPVEISACPIQELGPARKRQSLVGARIAARQHMGGELGAQGP